MDDPITIDFETKAIVGNPVVDPPDAVGVAIWVPGYKPQYYSWGHPEFAVGDPRWPQGSKNNITFARIHEYLKQIAESRRPLLFHNAPFDVYVWNRMFCNAQLYWINGGWKRIHDTMYPLFFLDPYARTLSLKPSADRYLGVAPTEQDTLHKWILGNVPGATQKTAGAYISMAPTALVAPYAIGDVTRTRALWDLTMGKLADQGMVEAYDRERRLMPIVTQATRHGIRINRPRLERHYSIYHQCLGKAREQLAKALDSPISILDSDELLADALERSGSVTQWVYTPKEKKRSLAKDNLTIVRPDVRCLYEYISSLQTCLSVFMGPWLEQSKRDGRLHPNWNQVKQSRGDFTNDQKGTRSGRLSSDSPNFQNVPTEFTDETGNPLPVPPGLYPLPQLRRYCLPEEGHVWIKRDFASQEIRILAHFEDGILCNSFRENPSLDVHQLAREMMHEMTGVMYERKKVKIVGFSLIYGTGVTGLASQLGEGYDNAYRIKEAYLNALPGVRTLMTNVKNRGAAGQHIKTWGGRIYYSEPPKTYEDGRVQKFDYKLLNYLIQGSAADQTKEAICDWADNRKWSDIFLATVHDEINLSVPAEDAPEAMVRLRTAMDKDRFDVPMRSEGFIGKENWQDLEKYEP